MKNLEDRQLGSVIDISATAAHLVVGCINHSISQPAWLEWIGSRLTIKVVFPGMVIPILKIRRQSNAETIGRMTGRTVGTSPNVLWQQNQSYSRILSLFATTLFQDPDLKSRSASGLKKSEP